jgi:hypothetical protein
LRVQRLEKDDYYPVEWSWDCQEKTKELGMKPWSAVSCDTGDRTLIRCRLLSWGRTAVPAKPYGSKIIITFWSISFSFFIYI